MLNVIRTPLEGLIPDVGCKWWIRCHLMVLLMCWQVNKMLLEGFLIGAKSGQNVVRGLISYVENGQDAA